MNYLVIGLGSMGKRRIRNLSSNNEVNVWGFDIRADRRDEVEKAYRINTFSSLEKAVETVKFDAFIISVAPDLHMQYLEYGLEHDIHCFVEASVLTEGMEALILENAKKPQIKICPSCTLRFHPSIKLIKKLVDEGKLGKLSNYSYHSGQYLPDWHPWESIKDYYVSNKVTGGCREIVPFELTWLNWVFGDIKSLCGFKSQTIDLDVDIDDVYTLNIKYRNGVLGNLIVDVVSRFAVRNLIINGETGQIQWDWNDKQLKFYDAIEKRWILFEEPKGDSMQGYNANIIENMYIDEIKTFIDCIKGKGEFPNSLEDDYVVLTNLSDLEKSDATDTYKQY